MLSSDAKSNRYQEMTTDIDCRCNGYKARKESLMAKTDAAVLMIERVLNAGIRADYVLMDTWFTPHVSVYRYSINDVSRHHREAEK